MTEQEFYSLIEGRDEEGMPNAECEISIWRLHENEQAEELATVVTRTGVVHHTIVPDGLSTFDIMFEDNTVHDYIRMGIICEKTFPMLLKDYTNDLPTLDLDIIDKDFSAAIICSDCVWAYIPASPENRCVGIRFIVKTEDINYHLVDEPEETV